MPSSYGTIKALSANIGPNNNEFTINKNNGKTNFKIDDPTYTQNQVSTEFTTNIGLNINSGDKNSDALQKIDGWISEKLCSKPPSGSFRSGHKTTTLLSAINETETTMSLIRQLARQRRSTTQDTCHGMCESPLIEW